MDFSQFARKTKKSTQSDNNNDRESHNKIDQPIIIDKIIGNIIDKSSKQKPGINDNSNDILSSYENLDHFISERKIPIANQIDLIGHTKAVSCISIEPSGNRLVTGSLDYAAKLYDFGGMDSRHRSFQSIEVQDSQIVSSISHSPSGDRFIVSTSNSQPKIYDRDGNELLKFVKGDMYLRDLSNTKGHTMEVTCVQWHPMEKEIVLTCSLDGTLRIWNLLGECTFGNLINKHVLKVRGLVSANRVGVTSCCYSPSGMKIIGGTNDGSIQIWLEKKVYSRADMVLRTDCCIAKTILSVNFSMDNTTLASRSSSGHVILWDTHNSTTVKTPLKIISGMNNDYPFANTAFSPDGSLLCCGTSPISVPILYSAHQPKSSSETTTSTITTSTITSDENNKSRLYFYEVTGTSVLPISHIALAAGASAIMVKWHPKTNQILCTMSSGVVRVLYDPLYSTKGALLSAHKAPKREKDSTDFVAGVGDIYYPLALPMYRAEMPGGDKKKKKAELKDPYLCKIPDKPLVGGPGTRPNNSFFFTNYMMKSHIVDESRKRDPRELYLSVDEETKRDPKIFGKAYNNTSTQLHSTTFEEEQDTFKKKQKSFN